MEEEQRDDQPLMATVGEAEAMEEDEPIHDFFPMKTPEDALNYWNVSLEKVIFPSFLVASIFHLFHIRAICRVTIFENGGEEWCPDI
jgi:hypothetical protein